MEMSTQDLLKFVKRPNSKGIVPVSLLTGSPNSSVKEMNAELPNEPTAV